jgi:hypothetical protein
VKINVPEKYAELYLKALTDRKKQLVSKIQEFQHEIDEIDHHIGSLTSIPIFQEETIRGPIRWETDGYRNEWTWTKKIDFIFHKTTKLCTAKYMVDFITAKEPDLDKSKIRSSISAALSNRLKNGNGRKFVDPVTDHVYYGNSDWFDQNESPLIDHIPDELKVNIL